MENISFEQKYHSFGKWTDNTYFVGDDPPPLLMIDTNRNNALHVSAKFGSLQVSKFLIDRHGFDMFNTKNIDGLNDRNSIICCAMRP